MGRLTISIAIFNSYVKLPEGNMGDILGRMVVNHGIDLGSVENEMYSQICNPKMTTYKPMIHHKSWGRVGCLSNED